MKNGLDEQYIELLEDILKNGIEKETRNGKVLSVFGREIRYKFKDGKFPLITTKKMYFKGIVTELLWFLQGRTDLRYLLENDCNIWTGDAYKRYIFNSEWYPIAGSPSGFIGTKSDSDEIMTQGIFIERIKTDDEFSRTWGDLGPVYGSGWRNWKFTDKFTNGEQITYVNGKVDQIANLIEDLKTNPDSRRLMVNAWNCSELDQMVLPPCFTEDMMVACVDGYRKISEITTNDLVLTEDCSYQKVYELHETMYNGDLIKFKVFGNTKYITCTPNHPFLIKDKGYISANEIIEDDYLAIPINRNSIIPSFDTLLKCNQYGEKLVTTKLDNFDYWFLMGYFMGDGWLISSKEEVCFVINDNQTDLILPRLKNIIGLAKLNNSGINCTKYVGKKKQVFEILSMFGKYADGKFIPKFVYDAPKEYIEQFIEGYFMADGCKTKDGISYSTVSENIAYGVQLLYAKLGVKVSVYFQNRPKKKVIEGREVNQKNTFSINVYKQKNKTKKYILDTDYLWVKIKEINKINFNGYVYNISVGNNHTYNVYNLINHNCHYGFQCYTRELGLEERREIARNKLNSIEWGDVIKLAHYNETYDKYNIPTRALSLKWNQRSVDTPLGLPFNIASYGLLLEILAKEVNMVPDELIGGLGDCHIYLNQIEGVKEQIGREYTVEEGLPKTIKLIGYGKELEFSLTDKREIEYYGKTEGSNETLWRTEKFKDNEVFYQTEFGWGVFLNTDTFETVTYDGTEWGGQKINISKRTREPFPLPRLKHMKTDAFYKSLSEDQSLYGHLDNKDFQIENYQSHPSIKFPLSN